MARLAKNNDIISWDDTNQKLISRTPRDRRSVPEERNGPANDLFQFDLRSTD